MVVKKYLLSIIFALLLVGVVGAWDVKIVSPVDGENWNEMDGEPIYTFSWNPFEIDISNLSEWNNFYINNNERWIKSNTANSDIELSQSFLISEDYNNLTIQFTNISGHSETATSIFFLDDIRPVLSVISPSNETTYINQNIIHILASVDDNWLKKYEDDEGNLKDIKVVYTGPTLGENTKYIDDSWDYGELDKEGRYEFTFYARDRFPNNLTNHEVSRNKTVIYDVTDPTVLISSPLASESPYNHAVDEISFNATDANLDYCRFSDGTVNDLIADCSSHYPFDSVEGNNVWTITAYDKAGNPGSATVNFFVDSIAPLVYFDFGSTDEGDYGQEQIFVNASAEDVSLDTLVVELRNGDAVVNSTNIGANNLEVLFSSLADGTYEVRIWANDSVGHVNETSRTIGLDSTYPLISYGDGITQGNINVRDVFVNVSIEEANLDRISYELYNWTFDGGNWSWVLINFTAYTIKTEALSWFGLDDGTYRYCVIVNDTVGNQNQTDFIVVTIDATAPEVNLVTGTNFARGNDDNDVTIEFNVSDLSTFSCLVYLNDSEQGIANTISSNSFNYTFLNLLFGYYSWYVFCNDSFNNNNISDTRFFTILSNLTNENEFDGNTTDLTTVDDITNVTYFFVSNSFGSINFTGAINFSDGIDWTQYINISENNVSVDTANAPRFNVLARITLFNLTWNNPQILKNGAVCANCQKISYTINDSLVFDVISFSEYTTKEYEAPSSLGGSPGGGSSSSSCTTEWTCTEWGSCIDGEMTRACSKIEESCRVLADMPIEVMSCSTPDEEIEDFGEEFASEETDLGERAGITGGAIGTTGKVAIGALIFVVLMGVIYFVVRAVRAKKRKEDDKKIKALVAKVGIKNRAERKSG